MALDIAQSLELIDVIQVACFIIISLAGLGIRAMIRRLGELDRKIDDFRASIRGELSDYVRDETCRARCDAVNRDIERLHAVHGVCRVTEHGVAVVDINNPAQMRDLRNLMSSDQRHAHAASCQFREDMCE